MEPEYLLAASPYKESKHMSGMLRKNAYELIYSEVLIIRNLPFPEICPDYQVFQIIKSLLHGKNQFQAGIGVRIIKFSGLPSSGVSRLHCIIL